MKVCPICGTENIDDAVFCKKCGYNFQQFSPAQPQVPSTTIGSTGKSNKKPILIGIIGAIIVIILIVGFLVIPSLTNDSFQGKAHALVATAESSYGGNWDASPDQSYSATISSNYEMKVTYLNGTVSTTLLTKSPISYLELSHINLTGTEMETFILRERSTGNNITILEITFRNTTLAEGVFTYSISSAQFVYGFAGISLNGTTINGYLAYYYAGGNISILGNLINIPGILIAKYQNQVVFIESNGLTLNQNFMGTVLSILKS